MSIKLKRIYDEPEPGDGYRVFVDRIWPRGVPKEQARFDAWMTEVAPSDHLRKSFHSGGMNWGDFRRRYLSELKEHRETLRPLAERTGREAVTLLYGSSDTTHNNAVVVQQYLKMIAH